MNGKRSSIACERSELSDGARPGRRTGQVHNFVCAKCGNPAAAVELIDGDGPIGVGPGPDGEEMAFTLRAPAGSVRLTWLGVSLREATTAVAVLLASAGNVDPLELARQDWELGAFCCRRCEQNYCASCWEPWTVFADDSPGWSEGTTGRCPQGHEQSLED